MPSDKEYVTKIMYSDLVQAKIKHTIQTVSKFFVEIVLLYPSGTHHGYGLLMCGPRVRFSVVFRKEKKITKAKKELRILAKFYYSGTHGLRPGAIVNYVYSNILFVNSFHVLVLSRWFS